MFSKIVVGTDGSDTAANAVSLAAELARMTGAELHLVAAFRPPVVVAGGGISGGNPPVSEGFSKLAAEHMLEEVAAGVDGLDVEVHARSGTPAPVIVQYADEIGADLIVVGSKGMQGTRRVIGSVPNSVAHTAGCSVLVAKTT
ncbi:MAG: universal stress protein [Acidimicrobiales bacterium]|jgi:nucleotide-binding universal stress UspA family protein